MGLLWFPYSRVLPHRHWLSHAPLVGSLIRAAYLAGIFWLTCALVGVPWPWDRLPPDSGIWLSWALFGLGVSDALHWVADGLWSRLRHLFRRRRRWVLDGWDHGLSGREE